MLQWIKEGAKYEPDPLTARPNRLEVLPAEVAFDLPGRTQRLVILAHYPDGVVRDVTRDAVLTSNSVDTVRVTGSEIIGLRRGEAAVGVRYEGNYGVVNVSIMGDRTGFALAPMPEYNFIDAHINAKLEKMKILPSEECTDAEFVRRVYLDLTGIMPTASRRGPSSKIRRPAAKNARSWSTSCSAATISSPTGPTNGRTCSSAIPRRWAKKASGYSANGFANRSPRTSRTTSSSAR